EHLVARQNLRAQRSERQPRQRHSAVLPLRRLGKKSEEEPVDNGPQRRDGKGRGNGLVRESPQITALDGLKVGSIFRIDERPLVPGEPGPEYLVADPVHNKKL